MIFSLEENRGIDKTKYVFNGGEKAGGIYTSTQEFHLAIKWMKIS